MFEVYDIAILPIIMGLVALLKGAEVPTKLLPFASVALGLVAGIMYISPNDLKQGILVGIVVGLSASGLYSGGKSIIEKEE